MINYVIDDIVDQEKLKKTNFQQRNFNGFRDLEETDLSAHGQSELDHMNKDYPGWNGGD